MDAPRRWQIASIVTAVAGLGLGGGALARPAVEEAPSIMLEPTGTVGDTIPTVPDAAVVDEPTIVTPDVTVTRPHEASRAEVQNQGAGAASSASVDSASAASAASVASASAPSAPSPASADSPASVDSPASPSSPASPDSPASVDSVSSIDS